MIRGWASLDLKKRGGEVVPIYRAALGWMGDWDYDETKQRTL
jgi:hypothetical protein